MANIKIAQLTNQTAISDNDLVIIETATSTNKMTVGTLKNMLGIPLGGIVESGGNAYGKYVKYSDGTMICTGRGAGTLTFPSQFLIGTSPEVSISTLANGLGAIIVASVVDVTNSNFKTSPKYWDGYTFQLAGEIVSYIAVGRWK